MPLTAASRFTWLTLAFDEEPVSITAQTEDGGNYVFQVGHRDYAATALDPDFIDLQALYVAGELRNTEGNVFTPAVWTWPWSNLLSDLERYGHYNPFDPASWLRWLEGRQVQGTFSHGAALNTEGDVEHEFGMNPILGIPEAGDFDQTLEPWRALAVNDTRVQLRLIIPVAAARTTGNVGEYLPIRGMLAYLETIRVKQDSGGNPVGTVMDPYVTTYDQVGAQLNPANQKWRLPQTASENVDLVLSSVTSISIGSSVVSVQINFNQDAASPNNYNVDAINSLLDVTDGALTGVVTAAVERPSGSPDVEFQGRRWLIDEHRNIEPMNDQILIHGRDHRLERDYEIPLDSTYSRSIPHGDLRNGFTGEKLSPVESHVRTVHFGPNETADGILQVEDPTKFVLSPGGEKDLEVHNLDAVRPYTFKDWDRNELLVLKPTEKLRVRVARRRDGTGEMTGLSIPERRLLASVGDLGVASSVSYYRLDSSHWIRSIPMPAQADYEVFDEDVYELGTAAAPGGGTQISSANLARTPQTFRIRIGGDEIHFIMEAFAEVNGAGTLNGHETRLVLLRQGVLSYIDQDIQEPLTGTDSSRKWKWEYLGPVEVGDIIAPMVVYAGSSSLSFANIEVVNMRIAAREKPAMQVGYTP